MLTNVLYLWCLRDNLLHIVNIGKNEGQRETDSQPSCKLETKRHMWCDVMWCDVMWCDVMWCDGCWLGAGCGTECLSPCHKLLLELHLESFNLQPQSWYDLLPETIHSHGLLTNIIPARIFKLSHFYKQATASVLYVQSVAVHCYLRGCLVGTKISRNNFV